MQMRMQCSSSSHRWFGYRLMVTKDRATATALVVSMVQC